MATSGRLDHDEAGTSVRDDLAKGRDEARALGNEFADLANDLRYLMQKEAELARAEAQESIGNAVQSGVSGVMGIMFAQIFLIFAAAAAMFALDTMMEPWLAALITAGGLFLITLVILAYAYVRMKKVSFTPKRTMRSLKEDMEWARSQMKSTAR